MTTFYGKSEVLVAPGPSAGGYVELFNGLTGAPVYYIQPFPNFDGGITTGQGVAPAFAALSAKFASVAPLPKFPGAPTSGSSNDTTGGDTSSGGDVFGSDYSGG